MITTHVLDTASGQPAVGLEVVLEVHRSSDWVRIASGLTDERGRLSLTDQVEIGPGVYRLTFDTNSYHHRVREMTAFFPEVLVTFTVRAAGEHVHVPLLVSPFGYTTYRGV
jgi:5-hydroxyisourate hydrolase